MQNKEFFHNNICNFCSFTSRLKGTMSKHLIKEHYDILATIEYIDKEGKELKVQYD